MKRYITILVLLLGLLLPLASAEAASPLGGQLQGCEAFRHVLETNDWLILCRLYLVPTSNTGYTDTFTVTTTGGDFDDPVVLVNRVHVTGATDYTVTAGATSITSDCTLGQDDQTINCVDTGLADASYTVAVAYRSGWTAYAPEDVLVRLMNGSTAVAEDTASLVGYALTGIYLTAQDVTDLGLTWGAGTIQVNALGSPTLWSAPLDLDGPITWYATANHDATVTTLTSRLLLMLTAVEQVDGAVDSGDYVATQGITLAGTAIAEAGFPRIRTAIPNAFLSSETNPFPGAITTPTASLALGIQSAVQATTTYTRVQAVHPTAGVLATLVLSVLVAGLVWTRTHQTSLAAVAWFAMMTGGWLLFAIPFPLVFISAALITATGFVILAKQVFD